MVGIPFILRKKCLTSWDVCWKRGRKPPWDKPGTRASWELLVGGTAGAVWEFGTLGFSSESAISISSPTPGWLAWRRTRLVRLAGLLVLGTGAFCEPSDCSSEGGDGCRWWVFQRAIRWEYVLGKQLPLHFITYLDYATDMLEGWGLVALRIQLVIKT